MMRETDPVLILFFLGQTPAFNSDSISLITSGQNLLDTSPASSERRCLP